MTKAFDELFDEAYELVQRANGLLAERIRLKQKAMQLRADYQADIDDLKEEADNLAQEFKGLFRESQEAYSSGQGALAKSLASDGKAKQSRCEGLNRQVKSKIEETKRKIDALYGQADEKQKEAKELIHQAKTIELELKKKGRIAWATCVVKYSKRGYQRDIYAGMKGTGQHLHDFYSIDERGIQEGVTQKDEGTKEYRPPSIKLD